MRDDDNPMAMKAKVSSKGWIVIPAALRRKYDITPAMRCGSSTTEACWLWSRPPGNRFLPVEG
ncbi:MAG: AbrB/MazE/SpoVT family DNA-binding domain-containing protein [Gemmatimonadetes bacterium]|nr:AbrB/MazE/SpoVT family DNA-binding domain-containing protein [Gemmatimonadota bacterium]MCK5449115.1 AbrB/MazE/SpoVT family DNA-binding domain-containing protein [Gemmatimonadota bacterium]